MVANHKGFFFYRQFSCWKFMSNAGVNVFSKQARFHDLGPVKSKAGDLPGWPIMQDFIKVVIFHVGNLCPILVSTFSQNKQKYRAWDQFHRTEGTCKGCQSHRVFFPSLIFQLEIYVQFWCQRFLETGEVSGHGTNSIE